MRCARCGTCTSSAPRRAARLDQGRGLASRAAQPARDAARGGDGRGGRGLADDRRSAASARLLRDQRRRRRDRRDAPEIAKSLKRPRVKVRGAGEAPKHQMGGTDRSRPFPARALVGRGRLRRSGRHAGRHQVRVDLRQLHHHRAHAARGSGLLREGQGRALRRRRQPDLGRRQAAVQHRRRRAVQQPPRPTAAASPR